MRKLTIMEHAIFFMNENEAYPSPDHNANRRTRRHLLRYVLCELLMLRF
ncbi:Uncharacterised protein [Serratia fonticola]|nr:Uncharacterised protein [Serratia fonticola]